MTKAKAGNRCAVMRSAIVKELDGAQAVLLVGERGLQVPIGKLAPGLERGDAVFWDGSQWTKRSS
ncbi:hypothetical protein IDH44_16210 [Paenibacillus sp. IB182496]|uniref:Uncharacterized protein n=1 Tax=Paenibacillus sabuli TaxID=2772509 RepID=A0A927BVN2_9BACL|nr:hypothetical protein [Paenibacillus sabuli]MBD2846741.1 hypothetical protein [Paenibacillus sabuli]